MLERQNIVLTDILKYFNNTIIPNRRKERLTKFGDDFFKNNI